jgi:fatty-acyl-CoA synthase
VRTRRSWSAAITLGDCLLAAEERAGDQPVLSMPAIATTYAGLAAEARRLARGLIGLGVRPGDRVAVLSLNGPETLAAMFAVALAGAIVVPANARYRVGEVTGLLRDSGATALLTNDAADDHVSFAELLADAVPGLKEAADPAALAVSSHPALRTAILFGHTRRDGFLPEASFADIADSVGDSELERRRALVGLRDPAILLYTSGTTATPRGALLSHEAIVRAWTGVADRLQIGADDVVWNPCPMFHIAALGMTLASVLHGATVLTTRYFEPGESVRLLHDHPPSLLFPAYAQIMLGVLNHPAATQLEITASRALVVGGPDTLRDLQRRLPETIVVSTFGMTESAGCSTMHELGDDALTRSETVGAPLPGLEARITDPATNAPLPVGEPGEIQLRGPLLCNGYHCDPVKTESVFVEGGWMKTGDQGVLDAAGRLSFRGRIRDMLKVGGENVSPVEIEAHLMTHPAVQMAQVVGIPDERLDEVPVAFIEARAGRPVSRDELVAHCAGRIARFKIPHAYYLVSEWPMSATKIQKFRLREQLLAARAGSDRPVTFTKLR